MGLLEEVLAGEAYLLFDGGMGTMLQRGGLAVGELPELLCLNKPDSIAAIHRAYVEAGSHVVTTNTFGANRLKLGSASKVAEVFSAAVACARAANPQYVAADIGPTGALLEPMGALPFDEAYELFAEQARAAAEAGADLVIIETMTDLLEIKAAVLAVKENCGLPVFASMTFGEDGRTFLGTTPSIAARVLDGLGVDALGINCSLGPADLLPLVRQVLEVTSKPVLVQANAGLPSVVDGQTVYSIDAVDYAAAVLPLIEAGASVLGGCCGTDPSYIHEIARLLEGRVPAAHAVKADCAFTSAQREVVLRGRDVAIIGERINPTGKKRLKEALRAGDYDYVIGMAVSQADAGADLLDVNAGLLELDEAAVLSDIVKRVQGVCDLPLQIDSADPAAVEAAVRVYAGKPLVNSVNGKRENLDAVLPVVAKYGCAVVGLTLDENGIPPTAEGRLAIAERIVEEAGRWGVPRGDVLIDCLVMSASTNQAEAPEILRAVSLVKERLGVRTVLGVSNVSFGLPARPVLNAAFLTAALASGLDAPIMNPLDERSKQAVDSWRVICGQDAGSSAWVDKYAAWQASIITSAAAAQGAAASVEGTREAPPAANDAKQGKGLLHDLIITGQKGPVPETVELLLATTDPLSIIDEMLIPALDEVGERFEKGTFFLPQLMASAEAAKAGFDTIRAHAVAGADKSDASSAKGPIVLATVKGDVHDIGKNIAGMLLENYGYRVIDLGRDVDSQAIVDAVIENKAPLVGLSALMTTTVRSMEEAIVMLRDQVPGVKVMVGGAVLTPEYAQMVGADYYSKDAAEGARIAGEVLGK